MGRGVNLRLVGWPFPLITKQELEEKFLVKEIKTVGGSHVNKKINSPTRHIKDRPGICWREGDDGRGSLLGPRPPQMVVAAAGNDSEPPVLWPAGSPSPDAA